MADEFTKAALYGIKTFNRKVKEKIGMEKLIELLNEYDGDVLEYGFVDGDIRRKVKNFDNEKNTWKSVVWYTKQFGFIKWLVENDKIDLENEELVSLMSELGEFEQYEKCLLMLLAIQDEPIRFLCEILK